MITIDTLSNLLTKRFGPETFKNGRISRRCWKQFFPAVMLSFLLLFSSLPLAISEGHGLETSSTFNVTYIYSRPVINVFYEPIAPEQRFTSMSDEDDEALLDFWKQSWSTAGWESRVLSLQDAKKHSLYQSFEKELDRLCMDEFGKFSLLRWLAMAGAGGGWLADYDAFPLRDFRHEELPNGGEMTIYEAVAPILTSGTAEAWENTAKYLLEHATKCGRASNGRFSFWTDTLGVLDAWRDPNCTLHVHRQVLDGRKAFTEQRLTLEDCNKRPFRGKRVVHFGHFAMLEAPAVDPELRLPRHRVTIAKQWLPTWTSACG